MHFARNRSFHTNTVRVAHALSLLFPGRSRCGCPAVRACLWPRAGESSSHWPPARGCARDAALPAGYATDSGRTAAAAAHAQHRGAAAAHGGGAGGRLVHRRQDGACRDDADSGDGGGARHAARGAEARSGSAGIGAVPQRRR
eukprot:352526-Chlamydomonas_euryale.AAC.6